MFLLKDMSLQPERNSRTSFPQCTHKSDKELFFCHSTRLPTNQVQSQLCYSIPTFRFPTHFFQPHSFFLQ